MLHDQTARHWMQAAAPVPLLPNAGFDGNGLHGGGLTFAWERLANPVPDVAEVLAALGQPVAPARAWVETQAAKPPYSAAKGYWANLPQDRALMLSILGQADETLAPGPLQQVERWLNAFVQGQPADPADRAVLMKLPGRVPHNALGLSILMRKQPELFVDSFDQLYRMLREGNEDESQSAAKVLLERGRGNPPGTFADEADAYLAALESGRQWGYLIQIVGRYGFDPTPVLQRELDNSRDADDGPDRFLLLTAASQSDPKWAGTLGPFVHELAVELTDPPPTWNNDWDLLRLATSVLMMMDRRDLAQDLRNRLDTGTLAVAFAQVYGSRELPETPEALRDILFGRLEKNGSD